MVAIRTHESGGVPPGAAWTRKATSCGRSARRTIRSDRAARSGTAGRARWSCSPSTARCRPAGRPGRAPGRRGVGGPHGQARAAATSLYLQLGLAADAVDDRLHGDEVADPPCEFAEVRGVTRGSARGPPVGHRPTASPLADPPDGLGPGVRGRPHPRPVGRRGRCGRLGGGVGRPPAPGGTEDGRRQAAPASRSRRPWLTPPSPPRTAGPVFRPWSSPGSSPSPWSRRDCRGRRRSTCSSSAPRCRPFSVKAWK